MKINNKIYLISLIFLNLIIFFNNIFPRAAITYHARGRFGDKLSAYINAEWGSHLKGIPVLLQPYKNFNKLVAAHKRKHYNAYNLNKFSRIIKLGRKSNINSINRNSNTLYILDFYFRPKIDWSNKAFKSRLKKLIKPTFRVPKINIPKGYASVAVHVRRGGGYDKPLLSRKLPTTRAKFSDKKWPKKFPPNSYYIKQIKNLSKILKNQKLFCYIFTDDPNPRNIVNKFNKSLKNKSIKLSCKNKNDYRSSTLHDFFAMQQFDYLIKSSSFFSSTASKIKDYKLVISPQKHYWQNNKLIISKVKYSGTLAKHLKN